MKNYLDIFWIIYIFHSSRKLNIILHFLAEFIFLKIHFLKILYSEIVLKASEFQVSVFQDSVF